MRYTDDPTYFQKVPIPNVPFVSLPLAKRAFRTDSLSAISLETTELVASIKQANTPHVEYMTDTLIKGMVGLPYMPAGQALALDGTPILKAPQFVELTHILVAAARHQPIVRKNLPYIVENYTTVPKAQLEAWKTNPAMAHKKLQCTMEQYYEPQYLALKENCASGFTNAKTLFEKYPTLQQVITIVFNL